MNFDIMHLILVSKHWLVDFLQVDPSRCNNTTCVRVESTFKFRVCQKSFKSIGRIEDFGQ